MSDIDFSNFRSKFSAEFEGIELFELVPETRFKDLEGWGSMRALIVIAMIENEYDITLTAEDISEASTLGELFELLKSRKVS